LKIAIEALAHPLLLLVEIRRFDGPLENKLQTSKTDSVGIRRSETFFWVIF
jgi:hypothetical protein